MKRVPKGAKKNINFRNPCSVSTKDRRKYFYDSAINKGKGNRVDFVLIDNMILSNVESSGAKNC